MASFINVAGTFFRHAVRRTAQHIDDGWFLFLLPWLGIGAIEHYAKLTLLSNGGFRQCAFSLGRTSGTLTVGEKLSLFRPDLLLVCFITPCVILLFVRLFPVRLRMRLSAAAAAIIGAALLLQVHVHKSSGGFVSAKLLWKAARLTAGTSNNTMRVGIPDGAILSLASSVAAILLLVAVAWWVNCHSSAWTKTQVSRAVAFALLFGTGCWLAFAATMPRMDSSPFYPDLFTTTLSAYADRTSEDTGMFLIKLSKSDPRQLTNLQRQLSDAPPQNSPSPYLGKAAGYNVVFFVLETAPVEVLDPANDDLLDMPNLRRLREHSFVATRHFSTVPQSNRVMYSMFTSMYTKVDVGARIGDRDVELPGFIRTLSSVGYETGFYGYVWSDSGVRNDRLLTSLGFDRIVSPVPYIPARDIQFGPADTVKNIDLEALHSLKSDIHAWAAGRQKFAAAFFAELAHDPWRDVSGGKAHTEKERGHALAVFQDAWLGELIQQLETDGILNNTIIIVTSDHGLRLSGDNQLLPLEKIDDVSFHMPLVLYVPGVLNETKRIDWPTSHIDLAPTVEDLLGITHYRELEQGSPLWSHELMRRTVFLSSLDDGKSANGYVNGNTYVMSDRQGISYLSRKLHFEDQDILPSASKDSVDARRKLSQELALEDLLLSQLLSRGLRPNRTPNVSGINPNSRPHTCLPAGTC